MQGVIRRYRVRLGTMEQAARHAQAELAPRLERLQGFVAWYLLDAGNGVLTTVGLFRTAIAADEAVRLQQEWFRDEWGSFLAVPPELITGDVLAQAGAEAGSDETRFALRRATLPRIAPSEASRSAP